MPSRISEPPVITEAGNAENVAGLVYVTAFVPDVGESVSSLIAGGSPPPLQPSSDGMRAEASVIEVAGSHAVYVSQPQAVADAIEVAARALDR